MFNSFHAARARSKGFGRALLRQSLIAISWAPVAIFFEGHVASIACIEGISMKPTFNPDSNMLQKDWVIENKWFWWANNELFRRGDVVTLRSPFSTQMVTKRIVAVAGDIVATRAPRQGRVITVPEGHVWLEGDERYHSIDSNEYGPVAINLIESKIERIIWPPSRFGSVASTGWRDPRISKRSMNASGNAADWQDYSYH